MGANHVGSTPRRDLCRLTGLGDPTDLICREGWVGGARRGRRARPAPSSTHGLGVRLRWSTLKLGRACPRLWSTTSPGARHLRNGPADAALLLSRRNLRRPAHAGGGGG